MACMIDSSAACGRMILSPLDTFMVAPTTKVADQVNDILELGRLDELGVVVVLKNEGAWRERKMERKMERRRIHEEERRRNGMNEISIEQHRIAFGINGI